MAGEIQDNTRGERSDDEGEPKLDPTKHDTSAQPEPRESRERSAPPSTRVAEEPAAEQRPPADS